MDKQTIKASLDFIIFENQETHYVVGSFSETETYHTFTGAGRLQNPIEDQEYELVGRYITHPKYGSQFQIFSAQKILPKKERAIVHFLTSDVFPTIGKKTAQAIYDTLGEECLHHIIEDPGKLDMVPGLNAKKKEIIKEGLQSFDGFNETYVRLMELGLDQKKIELLEQAYDNVLDVIEEDCFRPYYEIYGFGYRSALKLADGLEMDKKDTRRMDAYVYELTRNLSMATGNTYIFKTSLLEHLPNCSIELLDEILDRLCLHKSLHVDENKVYPFGLYDEEIEIAKILSHHQFKVDTLSKKDLDKKIEEVEFAYNLQYDSVQKQAIETFFNHSICIINGGPGTGKTTTVKGILALYNAFYPDSKIQLCAPTGRASKRLSQLAYADSKTIHSLLKWNKDDNTFAKDENDPLELDVLIIDEFSMVDTHLFCSLLKALPDHARILMIGDEDQLESVGPGKVFEDIISSQVFPVIHLEKIFRQKNGSGIVTLAKEIREEDTCTYEDGVNFIEESSQRILPTIQELTKDQNLDDFQILSPMYKGAAGIDAINVAMQEQFNPASINKQELKVGTTIFREDDKVMLLKNLPEEDVYNGDIGYIIEIDNSSKANQRISVDFGNRIVDFTYDFLYYLKHAYCISVHKAQGSEYDTVCCVVDQNSLHMLEKRLLYTGISRAKKQLFIIGQRYVFEKQVRLKNRRIRQTTLKKRIQDYIR